MVFSRFKQGLARTRNKISQALRRLGGDTSAAETLQALEEILYTADVGPLSATLLEEAEQQLKSGHLAHPGELRAWLGDKLESMVRGPADRAAPLALDAGAPTVILVVGVNGSGKTTSVAKLVRWLQGQGRRPLVAAADTFRAAAVEQLTIWCDRLGVELVKGATGADPAAVVHDACDAARARGADVLVIDTAGRLHTQKNLMSELDKVARVAGRRIEGAPHETLLVLDGTTGQNAVQQARLFGESVAITGVILAKLDGTAKGGAVLAIGNELGTPVKFVGLGEQVDDLEVFDPAAFVQALLDPKVE
ncbi:MAG: signal recognition particle-docking protein FtsY [Planctomycetes bacterium]|nr:signal recognition particle-docking protein FtsY [Planctomycetota bacterium]MBL7008924.1 signal recognition particle-docking protein FtsY [Planctomycetota bacterium]